MRSGVAFWRALLITGVALVVVVVSDRGQILAKGGVWTVKAPMAAPRVSLAVGVVNGILYAVGGSVISGNNTNYLSTVEAYDPVTNTWTRKAPMPTARSSFGVGVINGILYVVGGHGGMYGPVLDSLEAYDPTKNTWTAKAPMLNPREFFAVGVVNGKLHVVGGGGGPWLSTVEAYDPTTNTWTAKASMPTARNLLAVGVVNGTLYAVGGACCAPGESTTILNTVEAYNPVTNRWMAKAPIPTPRCCFAVGVVNGILYAVGGASPRITSAVEAYDPTRNKWMVRPPLPTARWNHAAGIVNGVLYAVGGETISKGGAPPNDWIAQFPRELLAFKP